MIRDPITTTEAAAILGLDPSAIRHRIRAKTLRAEKHGRDHMVSRATIQREADVKAANGKSRAERRTA